MCLISASYSGWAILSSGKEVYVSPTQASASEVGSAFKRLLENMQIDEDRCGYKKLGRTMKRLIQSVCLTCVKLTCSINDAMTNLYDLENKIDNGEIFENYRLSGIWDSMYVCKLGILDHCKEILTLQEEFIKSKITHCADTAVEECQIREMADLYIILQQFFSNKKKLVDARYEKFLEKSKAN